MAAGATYEPIATTTLGSASATITFSSIPATYTDLRLVIIPLANSSPDDFYLRFNSDSATNYSITTLYGSGSAAASNRATNATGILMTRGTQTQLSTPTLRTADIFSYAGSTYKTVLTTESSDLNGSGTTVVNVGLWRSTSAITTITLNRVGDSFAAGTTATIYGIKAA